jgi:uncharacterized protein (TIGR03546 family)
MLTRSIGKILRGKATTVQLALACILGGAIGFLPGYADGAVFLHAPGLLITLFIAAVILNANLPLVAMVAGLSKLVSLAIMPVSFALGRFLLDGPTQPLLQAAINAPVLALFGFEYYATTGGLLLGLLFGVLLAVPVVITVGTFRARMARLEQGSEAFRRYTSKFWVKALAYIFFGGGKGKRTYGELSSKRFGNPIRPLGVVFALLLVGLAFIVNAMARDEIVMATLRRGLESANGATVDIERARLDLRGGSLVITGLAMADPQALDTDLFRAATLEADVSGRDLLRKRIAIDRVVAQDAYTGEPRAIPGRLIRRAPPTPREPRQPGDRTLEDYLADAERWKDRLCQAQRWLDELEKHRGTGKDPAGRTPAEDKETLRQRLAREVREKGYARVAATHLIEGAPAVLIRELIVDGLRSRPLPGHDGPEVLDVRAENLSTHPWLVSEPPRISVRSRSEALTFETLLTGLSAAGGDSTIALALAGLPADLVGRQLKVRDPQPLQGGTLGLTANGTLDNGGRIHLPLDVTIRDTTIAVPRLGSAPVAILSLPVGVTGRLGDPRILWDQEAFADSLAKAGANELAGRVRAEASKALDKARAEATSLVEGRVDQLKEKAVGQFGDAATGLVGDALPTSTDELKETAEKAAEKAAEAAAEKVAEKVEEKVEERVTEELQKALPGLLPRRR